MKTQSLAAVLLIAAAVAVFLSSFVNAPGLYQTEDIEERLGIIEANRTRWLANQALVVAGALLLVGGFGLLAGDLRPAAGRWIPVLGAVAFAAGTLSGLYFVYLQTVDPRGGYSGAYPFPENLAYWLWLAGTVLIGAALLSSSLPRWLGYLTAGAAALYGVLYLATGAGFMAPFLIALLGLVIGVVLLRA